MQTHGARRKSLGRGVKIWDPGEAYWVCSHAAMHFHMQRSTQVRATSCRLLAVSFSGGLVTQQGTHLCLGKKHHFQSYPKKNSCSEGKKVIFSPKKMSIQEFISEELQHLTSWCRQAVSLCSPAQKDHSFPPQAWCGATFSNSRSEDTILLVAC